MKLCVIYGENTPLVRHIGFSVVKKKAAYHSAGSKMSTISGHDYEKHHLQDYVDKKGTSYTKTETDNEITASKTEMTSLLQTSIQTLKNQIIELIQPNTPNNEDDPIDPGNKNIITKSEAITLIQIVILITILLIGLWNAFWNI